jgi:hypothetical protein
MSDPKDHTHIDPPRTDGLGPTRVDPDLPGVVGTEAIHGNTHGYPHRDGEPEPEGRDYSGQGGVTGSKPRHAPPK